MGFKIKNSLTGEFEKLPILTLKGEKGETGGVEEYNKVDYMGNKYETLKQANDANVEYAVKTAIGEFNYLDYDGQHITATDTIEGRSKSAILKGQTLVNLCNFKRTVTANATYSMNEDAITVTTIQEREWSSLDIVVEQLKANTNYILMVDNVTYTHTDSFGSTIAVYCRKGNVKLGQLSENSKFLKFNTADYDLSAISIRIHATLTTAGIGTTTVKGVRVLEYQQGMENLDIPYFEGMQSVKMPVLTTTGKNLFNGKVIENKAIDFVDGNLYDSEGYNAVDYYTPVLPNDNIVISNEDGILESNTFIFYNLNKEYVGFANVNGKVIIPENVYYVRAYGASRILKDNIQIEKGTQSTSYEPYKSNILTVNEDVTLRGIGNVKDELDLMTGELTQRITEIVLSGSEKWSLNRATINHNLWQTTIANPAFNSSVRKNNMLCNKLIVEDFAGLNDKDYEFITINNGNSNVIYLKLDKTKVSSVTELKNYLQSNPLTVQYQLATESIKTVDLSDNHVYSYKDVTHYDCSSAEGSLVPTLSVKVPTDVQATIAQQRETIQTLNSENERLNQIQEALKASMLDSQVQLMNLSWDTDFEVFTLRESIAPKDSLMDSRIGSNIDKFSQAKFIIENDCPDLEKLNSQIEYYFSKDVFSQEQFEELTDLISIVKGENGCEY